MPNAKKTAAGRSGKKTKTYFFSNRRNQLILLCVVAAVAIAICVPIYQKNQAIKAEKQDFLAKQAQLEEIANKISEANKPDEVKSSQSCRYQSAKFEKGDLYCTVEASLLYQNTESESANRIVTDSVVLVDSTELKNSIKPGSITFPAEYDPQISNLSQKINKISNCSASYIYPYPNKEDNNLMVLLFCSKVSKAEHFPLEK